MDNLDSILEQMNQHKDIRKNIKLLREGDEEMLNHLFQSKYLGFWNQIFGMEDAKVRKNAAMLFTQLPENISDDDFLKDMTKILFDAYQREKILFVRPVYLKALSCLPLEDYISQLRNQLKNLNTGSWSTDELKHIHQEQLYLEQMIVKYEDHAPHMLSTFSKPYSVLLTGASCVYDLICKDFKLNARKLSYGVKVSNTELDHIFTNRLFEEVLFLVPLKRGMLITYDTAIEALCASKLFAMIEELFVCDNTPITFRIDVRGTMPDDKKNKWVKQLSLQISDASEGKLVNALGDYELLIRLYQKADNTFSCYLKLINLPDERFAYRKNYTSTSMKPVAAASMCALCSPYFVEDAQVLDCFCGSGTLLLERMIYAKECDMSFASVYGLDIYGKALENAKSNAARSGNVIHFIQRDFGSFSHDYLFDEIITEFPDLYEETVEETDLFYEQFFNKADEIMVKGGYLFLLCRGGNRIKKHLRMHPSFSFVEEIVFHGKRNVFILKKD